MCLVNYLQVPHPGGNHLTEFMLICSNMLEAEAIPDKYCLSLFILIGFSCENDSKTLGIYGIV